MRVCSVNRSRGVPKSSTSPPCCGGQAEDAAHERGLARPVGAEQGDDLARVQLEVDAADHEPVGVAERRAVQADEGGVVGHEHSCPARSVARFARITSR